MLDSFLIGLGSGLILLLALAYHNWKRSQLPLTVELQPNRLLTRYPLVFMPGKKSLLYFLNYWNQIPHYLAEHGYEVFSLSLPWSGDQLRMKKIHQFLEQQSQEQKSLHLFLDTSSKSQLDLLLDQHSYSCLKSVTLIPTSENVTTPWFWKIHLLLTHQSQNSAIENLGFPFSPSLKNFYLDRCQDLAERDLLQNHTSISLEA